MNEKEHKNMILYHWIKAAIFSIIAILVLVFREYHLIHLREMVGILMLLYGLEEIFFEWMFFPHQFAKKSKSYIGVIELMLGITLLCVSSLEYDSVCCIWAVWSMIRESYELKEIITELHYPIPRFISLVESIAVFVFSILLIINPTEHHALVHLYLLFFELILNPVVPLLDEIISLHKHEKAQPQE